MALVNHAKREINAKVVYFGPGMSGKETNLQQTFARLNEGERGKLKLMELQDNRMLFFDFLPKSAGNSESYNVRFHFYTLPGDGSATSWRMVLKGVDGVVFVADSDPSRLEANRESMQQLDELLAASGRSLREIPLVLQLNKRDLPQASNIGTMVNALRADPLRVVSAVARTGEGVLDTLVTITKLVVTDLRQQGLEVAVALGMEEVLPDVFPTSEIGGTDANPGLNVAAEGSTPVFSDSTEDRAAFVPVVEMGKPELEKDVVRLPLTVRCGDRTERLSIVVTVTSLGTNKL